MIRLSHVLRIKLAPPEKEDVSVKGQLRVMTTRHAINRPAVELMGNAKDALLSGPVRRGVKEPPNIAYKRELAARRERPGGSYRRTIERHRRKYRTKATWVSTNEEFPLCSEARVNA